MVSLSEQSRGIRGVSKPSLDALIAERGEGSIPAPLRYDALARFEELPVRQTLRGGRTWKHDLTKLDLSNIEPPQKLAAAPAPSAELARRGVIVCDFDTARAEHPQEFAAAFGTAVDTRDDKFASLALAFQSGGAFVWIPEGVQLDDPIVLDYHLSGSAFPYTLVALGRGASATVLEHIAGDGAFLCGIGEFVVGEKATLRYTIDQRAGDTTRIIATRRALLGRDSTIVLGTAELGAQHAVTRVRIAANEPGGLAEVTAFFFADRDQHVDLETEVVHAAAATRSDTVVRSAGTGHGQGRYIGNIKILKNAHGADAALRDNALLLSEHSHVDSVPALEIAANDVKAYHGATVGAISEDEIFYAQSRGLSRAEAERMIALGFFEPAIARFPGEALREEFRAALRGKLGEAPAP